MDCPGRGAEECWGAPGPGWWCCPDKVECCGGGERDRLRLGGFPKGSNILPAVRLPRSCSCSLSSSLFSSKADTDIVLRDGRALCETGWLGAPAMELSGGRLVT